ncbi:hypothetical protein L226DRAFT_523022 [Lentinus tigrinus ALCF2SS1-7]|uniref:Uncharacterized protein n=1 Tax=Lentinus tigrinus ALCF2SS1-6 TaxID=1328759 RepID=A0A5C2RU38_9APHY|nr:hypothetical protein L227DRAFT_567103 [Lentinus tigrinus ALCF2SS1-6]RPD75326.1 hypothetical protein L226DRAFT_523022 [Lentinus tigrinus ALCF2SS1-7]
MAATLGYSSFFSSGLLAPHTPGRAQTPRPPSPTTPRAAVASLVPDDTTPTGASATPSGSGTSSLADQSQVLPSISVAAAEDSRPRLRRRRSSLAGAASPLVAMKSSGSIRQATASVQRNLRTRAGSDASILSTASGTSIIAGLMDSAPTTSASKPSGIIGRLRSGSLGTALRPRRGLRRPVPSVPALPPPSAPLPDVPPVPALSASPTSPLPTITASPVTPRTPASRPPLMHRTQTFDNYELSSSPFTVAGASPMCLAEDEDTFAAALRAGVPSSPSLLAKGRENDMQVDYPSPVDGAAFEWAKQN